MSIALSLSFTTTTSSTHRLSLDVERDADHFRRSTPLGAAAQFDLRSLSAAIDHAAKIPKFKKKLSRIAMHMRIVDRRGAVAQFEFLEVWFLV